LGGNGAFEGDGGEVGSGSVFVVGQKCPGISINTFACMCVCCFFLSEVVVAFVVVLSDLSTYFRGLLSEV